MLTALKLRDIDQTHGPFVAFYKSSVLLLLKKKLFKCTQIFHKRIQLSLVQSSHIQTAEHWVQIWVYNVIPCFHVTLNLYEKVAFIEVAVKLLITAAFV